VAAGRTATVTDPLIVPPRRRLAAGIAVGCAVVVLALAVLVHGDRSGTRFDDRLYAGIIDHFSTGALNALLHLTDPITMAAAVAALAVAAALRRRWRLCAVTVAAPLLALLLTEGVLKPLVDRTHEGMLAYPSGHESAPACLATIVTLLLLRTGWPAIVKTAVLAVLVAYLVLCSIALVGAFLHYVTDTVGAVCLSVACVLGSALVADSV
jgi:undecaprenyl-diphosphatase